MLTGERPFKGEYEPAVVYSILNVAPEPIQHVDGSDLSGLDDVIARLLQKDPSDRYDSASAVYADLSKLSESAYGEIRAISTRSTSRSFPW